MKKAFNFEIYTKNPQTHEQGWDIKFVDIYANSKREALQLIADVPHFDCIILFNHETDISEETKKFISETGAFYCFTIS